MKILQGNAWPCIPICLSRDKQGQDRE